MRCSLCGSEVRDVLHGRFCGPCAERAIQQLNLLLLGSGVGCRDFYEVLPGTATHVLQRAVYAASVREAVCRLDRECAGGDPVEVAADPVRLVLLAVTVANDLGAARRRVAELEARVADLEAELRRLDRQLSVRDLGDLVVGTDVGEEDES